MYVIHMQLKILKEMCRIFNCSTWVFFLPQVGDEQQLCQPFHLLHLQVSFYRCQREKMPISEIEVDSKVQ